MAHEDDLFVAQEGLSRGFFNQQQLHDALWEMYGQERATGSERWPLGVLLVSTNVIPESILFSLLAERVRRTKDDLTASQEEDLHIGRLLVLSGTLEPEQVNEALDLQVAQHVPGTPSKRLGQIIVDRGLATPAQIQRTLTYQRAAVFACSACGRRFQAKGATPRSVLSCPKCKGALVRSQELGFDEAVELPDAERSRKPAPKPPPVQPAKASVGGQAAIDRALAIYIHRHSLVPPEDVRVAQSVQLEMSRFGFDFRLLDVMRRLSILSPRHATELESMDFTGIVNGTAWSEQTVPGYRVTKKLAEGETTQIFAAEPIFGGDTVALKILHPDRARSGEIVARFKRESDLLVRFRHPAIVKGLETGSVGAELHFLTLEYVDAESLDHVLQSSGPVSLRGALRMTAQIAHGLMYMERQGYLHRDVRPQNIVVDRGGYARLSDLGLAAEPPGATSVASTSAAYMSPEQAHGAEDLNAASDVFSLGLTLYAMLSGRTPFAGHTEAEIHEERFGSGRVGTPDLAYVPDAARPLLRRMLEPERRKRIQRHQDIIDSLKQL